MTSWTLPFLWYSHLFHGRGSLNMHPSTIGAISMKIRLVSYLLSSVYYYKYYNATTLIDWIPLYAPIRMTCSGILCLAGQVLNTSVYNTLGVTGVYYGRELGYPPPPWVNGFPFIIPHPQYVGCIMTVLGLGGLFGFSQTGPRTHILYLTTYVTWLYTYAMMSERVPKLKKSISESVLKIKYSPTNTENIPKISKPKQVEFAVQSHEIEDMATSLSEKED